MMEGGPVEAGDGAENPAAIRRHQLDAGPGRSSPPHEDREGTPRAGPSLSSSASPGHLVAVDRIARGEAVHRPTIGASRMRRGVDPPRLDAPIHLGFSPPG